MEITASMVKELREKTQAGMMDCKKALMEAQGDMSRAVDVLREKGLAKVAKKSDRVAAEGLVGMHVSADGKTAALAEVNSETDFVAKNEEFKGFVAEITRLVMDKKTQDIEQFMQESYSEEGSVQDVLNNKISKIGENMNIRRIASISAKSGRVSGYVHGGGKIGVLVRLEADKESGALEQLGKDIAMQIAAMSPKYISGKEIDEDYKASEREILVQQALNEENEKPQDKRKPQAIIEKMVEGRLSKQMKEVTLLDQPFVKDPDITVGQLVEQVSKETSSKIEIAQFERFEVGEGIEKKSENFAEEVAKQMGN